MSVSPALPLLLWPADRLDQALNAAGGGRWEAGAPPGLGIGARGGRLDARASALLEVEIEEVEVPWPDLDRALPSLAPAVLQLASPGAGLLVLLRGPGGWVVAVGPDGRRQRMAAARLTAELRREAARPLVASVDAVLGGLALLPRRRRRARRALLAAQLGAGTGLTAHVLTPRAAGLRGARLALPVAALVAALAVWQVVALASWILLGRGVLRGGLEAAWLTAWTLLLGTLALAQAGELAAAAVVGHRAAMWLRRRLFAALVALGPDRQRGEGTGRLLGRLLAAEALERALLGAGPAALVAAVELAGSFAVLAHGARAAAHLELLAAALASAVLLAAGHQRELAACAAAQLDATDTLVEAMAGHRTRLAEGDGHLAAGEDLACAGYHARVRQVGRWEIGLRTVLPRVWLLAGVVAMAAAAGGTAAPGRLAASLGGLLLARAGLGRLAWALCEMSRGRIAARQGAPILAGSPAGAAATAGGAASGGPMLSEAPRGVARLVEARGVTCNAPDGSRSVISAASLEILPGERVLLDGPSGAGKSTLAAVLAAHRRPDSGLLLLWGLDLATRGDAGWRRGVVAVPQLHENHLFADTLAFNLLLGRGWPATSSDLAEAEAVCRELGLGRLLERLPAGLEERIGEAGWQLSDGEASRVCLARALLQAPDLLILDESLAALDPETRLRVLEVVGRRAGTLVLIAHGDPELVGDVIRAELLAAARRTEARTSGRLEDPQSLS
jgi:ATP-binding cassette subfamily B protein